jgi:hypothetical protein
MNQGPDPVARFQLTEVEALVLEMAKFKLMWNDCQLDGNNRSKQYFKSLVIQDFVTSVGRKLAPGNEAGVDVASLPQLLTDAGVNGSASWVARLQRAVESNYLSSWLELLHEEDVLDELGRAVNNEARAALLVIELAAFSPWGDNKVIKRHEDPWRHQIRRFMAELPVRLNAEAADRLLDRLEKSNNALSRTGPGAPAIAALMAGGLVVGAATGGLAAPAVGNAVGQSVLGLAGAAATNAGLALLGGGSLAAGGFGMAGGTAVVASGLGAVTAGAAGAGAAGVRAWVPGTDPTGAESRRGLTLPLGSPEEELAESAKLLVLTPDVIVGLEQDPSTARLILERLRDRRLEAEKQRDATRAPTRIRKHAPPASRRADILRRAVDRLKSELDG